ncbi:class I SAM-dependent DNA methyltransferase [uncultured Microscilla sp.]|uniref:type I restriction-modification system subunit M n=1 Tax=uncultured Microscilla sp. TaxID=432653 RepID=UPI00261312D4|nr:class I SAM-dependent DNA methyltransferase [uncultured Microscilla sp.]
MSKFTFETLEGWLWDSVNILQSSANSSDFKNYIFSLLFLKRFNDVFEEKVAKRMDQEGLNREDAEKKVDFKIPSEARWQYLTKQTENIGTALDKALEAIERENQSLEGVMTAVKFDRQETLSSKVLQRLLHHFDKYSLQNKDLESGNLLGNAFEYLIKQFADSAGKEGDEFYTPRGVASLIVHLIKPQPGHHVYDPTYGSGGMLIESARYVADQPGGIKNGVVDIALFGQEKKTSTWAIGRINMILHNFESADLQKGDTLVNPRHTHAQKGLQVFDRIIANPPFSLNGWWMPVENAAEAATNGEYEINRESPNYAKEVNDPFERLVYGVPPRSYADFAFLQHVLASLQKNGKAGIVLPHGALCRGGSEGKIRQALLQDDLVEGIVGLPSALFCNTDIPVAVWILNKDKNPAQKGRVAIVEASRDYQKGEKQNQLLETHINKIVKTYEVFADVDKYMRIVPLEEIAENDYNLDISRYVSTSESEPAGDTTEVKQRIADIEVHDRDIDVKISDFLRKIQS